MKIGSFIGVVVLISLLAMEGSGTSPFKDPTHSDTLAVYLRQTSYTCDTNLFSGIVERFTFYYGDYHGTGGKHISVFGIIEMMNAFWHVLATCII